MMASMAQPAPQGRMSQLLPTVKCSNCSRYVPLSELGEHVCATPPPVPTLPKPGLSPADTHSLLPPRLQDRLPSPISPRTTSNDFRGLPSQQRLAPPNPDRLKINTASPSSYQSRASPLGRTPDAPSPARLGSATGNSSSPLRNRPPGNIRTGTPLNAGSVARPSSPSTARPPPLRQPTSNPRSSPVSEKDPDTKTGGEAGMAGVGRRGFAAAARAALITAPGQSRPLPPQPRRENTPYLNTDVPRRSNETPPLSAGSGYSSHSPGVSPYPQSPVGQQGPPSPERYNPKAAPLPTHKVTPSIDKGLPISPASLRMPFFDKHRNQLPGVVVPTNDTPPIATSNPSNIDTPSTAKQTPFPTRPRQSESTSSASSYSQGQIASRSGSINTTSSYSSKQLPPPPKPNRPSTPPASDSGSDYGGLAYAEDSTDYEDAEPPTDPNKNLKGKPPPLPLASSILRAGSISTQGHIRFPSASTSVRSGRERPSGIVQQKARDRSVSSTSSVDSSGREGRKSNSAAIAHALGLSQTSSSAYSRLGGPGVGIRTGRSATTSTNSTTSGSSGSKSAHVRGGPGTSVGSMGTMERELKTLLDKNESAKGEGGGAADRSLRTGLSKSKSTGRQRTFGGGDGAGSGSDSGAVKAPLSAKNPVTSTAPNGTTGDSDLRAKLREKTGTEKAVEPTKEKKERVRKTRVCLKCERKIDDGKWVDADGTGGVLCEKCWKHMYLPKCRRCNLPIEKQAVSSADGQLKGKYHRECFNCAVCSKPFPDKTFYVFDGRPLCAYHYHEANDSLCAATRCGQPIEGPCAVSHAGDRYHPEHMLCEYAGNPSCKQTLAEYWEVDGRMLCERHAHASKVGSDDEEGEERWVRSAKSLKRVTRYIDLAGGPPSAGR